MTRRNHAVALLIALAVMLSMLASSAYIVHETAHHHDCTGENCHVCAFIAQITQLHRSFGGVLLLLLAAGFLTIGNPIRHERPDLRAPVFCTLVGRKIRLND